MQNLSGETDIFVVTVLTYWHGTKKSVGVGTLTGYKKKPETQAPPRPNV